MLRDDSRGGAAEAEHAAERIEGTLPSISAQRQMEPARLTKLVRGELDWIVMKALEKDRNRRYETANGLAMDLRRYLADEPVVACPPSRSYRIRKFVQRNKGPVVAAFLVLLALVAGVIGTTWGMLRANHSQTVAVNAARQKEIALRAARKSEQNAQDQLFLALLNQAPRRPLQPAARASASIASLPWSRPPASGPTSDYATRPLPRWPCPTCVASREAPPRSPALPWWATADNIASVPD